MQVQFLRTDINFSIATINKNRGRNAPILFIYQRGTKGHKGDGSICALFLFSAILKIFLRAQIEPSPLRPVPFVPQKTNRVPGERIRDYIV